MKRFRVPQPAGRELEVILRVILWILVGVVLAFRVWRAQPEATASLFESNLTLPAATSTSAPSPTAVLTAASPPSGLATDTPVPALQPATAEATVPQAPQGTPGTAPASPRAPALAPGAEAGPTAPAEGQRYPTQQARLGFDWRLLFDTLALGVSYLWLGCGGLLLVGVVLLFLALWRAGRPRRE